MNKHIGLLLAVFVFVVQGVLLPHVGMSWDEPSSFFIGRANLKFWMTGNRAYLNDLTNKALFADSPVQYIYGEDIYPPFPFLVSSALSLVFAEKLHLIDVWDAHHLGEVLIGAFGVWAMYGLAIEVGLAPLIAIGVTLAYATYPTIADLMRNDAKDIPLLSLLVVSAYFFIKWIKAWRFIRYGLGFAVFLGLAEASKPTAAIFVPIALVWLGISSLRSIEFRKSLRPFFPFFIAGSSFLLIAVFVFFIAWPWLWEEPVGKLLWVVSFFKTVGFQMPVPLFGTMYKAGVDLAREYPFVILLVQSPVELSVLAVVGIVASTFQFVRFKKIFPFLFVVWFFISMGRFLIPEVLIYSRVRHFIDAMPAYFILAGFGVQTIMALSKRRGRIISFLILGVVIVHQLIISVIFFPYEMTYFNILTGGTKNVAQKELFDVGTASGVKEAMEFIQNDSAGKPVLVYPCQLKHLVQFYMSPNIRMTRAPELANYSIAPNSPSWFGGTLTFSKANHDVAYTVSRGGADLFYVFKYKSMAGWKCGWETLSNYE